MRQLIKYLLVIAASFASGRMSLHGNLPFSDDTSNDTKDNIVRVVRVVDGDTIRVMYTPDHPVELPVRLLGVDCPERNEKGFNEATNLMEQLVNDSKYRVFLDFGNGKSGPSFDRFGRMLADVKVMAHEGEESRSASDILISSGICGRYVPGK